MKKKNYIKTAKDVIFTEIEGLKKLKQSLDKNFNRLVEKIIKTTKKNGKICFIGLGKSGAVAERASKTFSSTKNPALFINASEFLHGDSGVLQSTDLIIIASSSGEQPEYKACIKFAKRWGIYLVAVCQKKNRHLAAIKRFKVVVENYDTTAQIPEALYRLTQSYLSLGIIQEAKKTTSVLAYNYKKSNWYKLSYELLKKYGYKKNGKKS